MSGGQQQRVAIARAIVGERRLILADEPTGALDSETGEDILRLIRARCDAGAAGVLVTHEARHAAWADRVVFLRDGVIVDESGSDRPDALLEQATMTFVSGWRLALRLAWREAWRSKARSVLVLVMVTFPVVAVIAADVAQATAERELGRGPRPADRLGAGEGRDASRGSGRCSRPPTPTPAASPPKAGTAPRPTTLTDDRAGARRIAAGHRAAHRPRRTSRPVSVCSCVDATSVDLQSPLSHGLFRLTSGRWPTGADEVAVNGALADQGYAVGDTVTERDGTKLSVVGTAESASQRTAPVLVGDADLLPAPRADGAAHLADRRRARHVEPGPRAERPRHLGPVARRDRAPAHDRAAAVAGA